MSNTYYELLMQLKEIKKEERKADPNYLLRIVCCMLTIFIGGFYIYVAIDLSVSSNNRISLIVFLILVAIEVILLIILKKKTNKIDESKNYKFKIDSMREIFNSCGINKNNIDLLIEEINSKTEKEDKNWDGFCKSLKTVFTAIVFSPIVAIASTWFNNTEVTDDFIGGIVLILAMLFVITALFVLLGLLNDFQILLQTGRKDRMMVLKCCKDIKYRGEKG